jgi:hypothetical protein
VLRWFRNLSIAGLLSAIVLWILIQTNPRFGPWLADTVRSVVGPSAVAWAEDVAYGAQDKVNGWRYKGSAPKTFWDESAQAQSGLDAGAFITPDAGSVSDAGDAGGATSNFPPANFAPPFPGISTRGEGLWIPMVDDIEPGAPVFAKTLVHPDEKRPYSAVAVVAMDLSQVELHLMAGTDEPAGEAKRSERPGKIPENDHDALLAVFNGGWQAVHGHFGMMVDGLSILPPKEKSCTIALLKPPADPVPAAFVPIVIAPWTDLAARTDIASFRQTPPCLRTQGSHNELLKDTSKNWGAAVDGATVIRRSALGIDAQRKLLFYGVGDSLSALTIAEAMGYAGAKDAAELDVNWAFPRFLTYVHDKKPPTVKETLIPSQFKPHEYVGSPWYRDFFYVTRSRKKP